MSIDELPGWTRGLGLRPHPEGGYFAETWTSPVMIPQELLPGYRGSRPLATCILFLLLPGQISAWHTVNSDELWIHQRGGPLLLGLGGDDLTAPAGRADTVLGTDASLGQRPQVVVPAGFWQTARPAGDEPVLVACVVAPGFDYRDWRLLDADDRAD